MKRVAYIGYGDLGEQISFYLREKLGRDQIHEIYFDDNLEGENSFRFTDYNAPEFSDYLFYISIGYKHLATKRKIIDDLKSLDRKIGSFIHHTSFIHPSASIEEGVVIYPGCLIDRQVVIRSGSLLNNSVVVSHNSMVGSCCFLAPGVVISGNVSVNECSFLGTGTLVANGVQIGSKTRLGIGSVVTKDLADGTNAIGNPLKILNTTLNIS